MLSKEKIKQIKKLHSKKGRSESGLFLVEGRKMILELLSSDWRTQIEEMYVNNTLFEEIVASFSGEGRELKREFCVLDTEAISKISTLENNTDGVVVVRQMRSHPNPTHTKPHPNPLPWGRGDEQQASRISAAPFSSKGERIQDGGQPGKKKYYQAWTLVLDGIRDPGNMGTILRTASWFGIRSIICSEDSVELYNPKVVSATMGAIFHLHISYENLEIFYNNNTLGVYGAELGGKDIAEVAFPKSGVLVLGSESHGISEISRKYMTQGIMIPKIGYGESLNVGVASGILLSHISQL